VGGTSIELVPPTRCLLSLVTASSAR